MVFLEDFTRTPAGCDVPLEGRVECCPNCGRPGIEQHSAGGPALVIHSQTSEILGDGMRVEPRDCCALRRG
jgi:hypothetical protein